MPDRLRLSILDFCDVTLPRVGRLVTTLELAMLADRLGYSRYWLAEHYTPGGPHSDALLLTFAVASVTHSLRVGPAGVIMTYRHPFQVASTSNALISFFDDRIDVGLCAGGAPSLVHDILEREGALGNPYQRVIETLDHLRGQNDTAPIPWTGRTPPVWLLGSGHRMASLAAERGTRFCLSLAHSPQAPSADILKGYLDAFRPSADCKEPETAVLVAATCGETPDAAQQAVREYAHAIVHRAMPCAPATCREQLSEVGERYAVDEIVVLDVASTYDTRVGSLNRFAEACALEPPAASTETTADAPSESA